MNEGAPWDLGTQRPDVAVLVILKEEFRELRRELCEHWYPRANLEYGGYDYLWVDLASGLRCVASFAGRMSPEEAVHCTNRLLEWQPVTIVNIGIAAGLHSDVRIGDVVVPDVVVAYDKTSKVRSRPGVSDKADEWVVERRSDAFRTSHRLAEAIKHIDIAHGDAYQRWQQKGNTDLSLIKQSSGDAIELLLAQENNPVLRERPEVLIEQIASGHVVVAASAFSRWVREANAELKALEMEAAGMLLAAGKRLTSVDTLVIRGISDHTDVAKEQTEAIKAGALRGLAMRNAWRFFVLLLERGMIPSRGDGGREGRNEKRADAIGAAEQIRNAQSELVGSALAVLDREDNTYARGLRADVGRVLMGVYARDPSVTMLYTRRVAETVIGTTCLVAEIATGTKTLERMIAELVEVAAMPPLITAYLRTIIDVGEAVLHRGRCTRFSLDGLADAHRDSEIAVLALERILSWYIDAVLPRLRAHTQLRVIRGTEIERRHIEEMIAIDRTAFSEPLVGRMDTCASWHAQNPEIYTAIVEDPSERVVGYINAMPLAEETYEHLKAGRLLDTDIPASAVCPYSFPGEYRVYLCSIAVLQAYRGRRSPAFRLLFEGFLQRLLELARNEDIYVSELMAAVVTVEGNRLCRNLGLTPLLTTSYGSTIYCGTLLPPTLQLPTEVGGEVSDFYRKRWHAISRPDRRDAP